MDFGYFDLEPFTVDETDINQENEYGELGEFRSRCNTWPRQQLQTELLPRAKAKATFQNDQESGEDLPNFQSTTQFGSTSRLNFQPMSIFSPASSRFPNSTTAFGHVRQTNSPKVNSVGSPGTANTGPGINNVLPLVSEEDFLEDLNALSNEIESSLNMVIPEPGIDMDVTPVNETNREVITSTADDPTGFITPVSPAELSSKHKTNQRRNPWGNISYADLITQAIQSAPDQRLTLAQIYEWLSKNVQYFKEKSDNVNSIGWKNSIRHNLSLHSKFVRVQSDGAGKSSWWTLDPEITKQSNQSQKPIRRRAHTLESSSLQTIRPGRRGRGSSVNPGYRKRDVSGCSTPLHGRRPSMNQLDRAISSQSLSYPDSPGMFAQAQPSPDYLHSRASAFSGPIRTRTLSIGSSYAGSTTIGGRQSPFRPRASSAFSLESYKSSSPTWKCASPGSQEQANQAGPVGIAISEKEADFNDAIQIITSDMNLMGVPSLNYQPQMDSRVLRNQILGVGGLDGAGRQSQENVETHSFYTKNYEEHIPSYKIKILEPRSQSFMLDSPHDWSVNRCQYLSQYEPLPDENDHKLSVSLTNDSVLNYAPFVDIEDSKTELPELLQEDLNFFLNSKPSIGQKNSLFEDRLGLNPVGQTSSSTTSSSGFYKLANNSSSNLLSLQS